MLILASKAKSSQRAFTIVELLIVIVVIAILAAISIVAYTGIQNRANTSALDSDLRNASNQLEIERATEGIETYATKSASGGDLKKSSGTTFQYSLTNSGQGFCLTATRANIAKHIVNGGSPQDGVCSGHTAPAAGGGGNAPANGGNVTTYAGDGTEGFSDGAAAQARFDNPYFIARDVAGNLYISDNGNNRIRKITQGGEVSTLAGSGVAGYADGPGATARFNRPAGIAVDTSGNVYVADRSNRIRKISPSGEVSTLAGSGVAGYADGQGTTAQFSYPDGLAVDSSGNVYVADGGNSRIRKISPAGLVTTLAGSSSGYADGQGAAARFAYPFDVDVDSSGNVFVVDINGCRVRKVTPSGSVSTVAGSGACVYTDGATASAEFAYPSGIAVNSAGHIFVAAEQRIQLIANGTVSTLAGSNTSGHVDGPGSNARFTWPYGLVVDSSGAVYVADSGNNRIRKIE